MSLATLFQEVENAFRPCCSTGISFQEEGDHFVLEALAAGVKGDQIEISVEKGSVCIEAKSDKYKYSDLAPLPVGEIDPMDTRKPRPLGLG
jgi:HSP20 family molecular chaperone IbpA